MDGINRKNWDKNAQKERTARRTARKPTSSDCQCLHSFSSDERGASVFIAKRATSYHIRATSTHLGKRRWNRWLVLVHLPQTSCCFPCFHRGWEQGFRLRTFAPNEAEMTIKTILIWDLQPSTPPLGRNWKRASKSWLFVWENNSARSPNSPTWCTTGTCAEYWTSASERSSTIGIRPCCPLSQSGISAITNVRMWKLSLPSPTEKYNDYGTRNRKQRSAWDETTHLRHQRSE